MTRLEVNRRELMQLGLSAGVTVVGGSMLLRARAAHAADGEVVAAVFPGSWEDSFQNIVASALKEAADVDLILSPALASDQLGKMMASPGSPPYDALLMSPGQTAIAIENDLIERVDPTGSLTGPILRTLPSRMNGVPRSRSNSTGSRTTPKRFVHRRATGTFSAMISKAGSR